MEDNPLDIEQHGDDDTVGVWGRRIMLGVLIVLCIGFAIPGFSTCSGAISGSGPVEGRYVVAGRTVQVTQRDFQDVTKRLRGTFQYVLRFPRDFDDDDVWRHILQNEAAVGAGVHVPREEVGRWLMQINPSLSRAGEFDTAAYERMVKDTTRNSLSHRETTLTLQEILRIQAYTSMITSPAQVVPSKDAFEAWQTTNEKLSVAYVVQEFDALRSTISEPTDEELRKWAQLAPDKEKFQTPPRRTVETAYLLAAEVTREKIAALEEIVAGAELLRADMSSDAEAYTRYFARRDVYSKAAWIRLRKPKFDVEKAAHDELVTVWEAAGKKPEDDPGPPPEDPAAVEWPDKPVEMFKTYWKDFVKAETLGEFVLRHMAERARRESKSFVDLAPEFAAAGIRVVKNSEALSDEDFADGYPEGLGKDSELAQTVRQFLKGPSGDVTFTPQVHGVPVPTTSLNNNVARRGYLVVRLDGFVPSEEKPLEESREDLAKSWIEHQLQEGSRKRLDAVRKAVEEEGKTLEDAAAEVDLEVKVFKEFNNSTIKRVGPRLGDDPDPTLVALTRMLEHRGFVQGYYRHLKGLAPGDFGSPAVVLHNATRAAYLMRLVEKILPERVEITESRLRQEATTLGFSRRIRIQALMDFDELVRRYQLEKAKKPTDPDDEEAESAESEDDSAI